MKQFRQTTHPGWFNRSMLGASAVVAIAASLLTACGGGGSAVDALDGHSVMLSRATFGTTANWANVKYGGGGYVPGLVYHPTTPNLMYARTDIGGVYRWDEQTSAWIPLTDGFGIWEGFFNGAESLALDPNDDQRVYIMTGLDAKAGRTGRLSISTNRGKDWTHVYMPFPVGSNNAGRAMGERLMVDPNKPSDLYYATRTAGLWKSTDYGQTWHQVSSLAWLYMSKEQINAINNGNVMGVESVLFDTSTKGTGTATQTIYAAVAPDYASAAGMTRNLYKSNDGGATWTGVDTPVSGYHIPHMVRAADGVIYVAFTQGSGPGATGASALYKYSGGTWTLLKHYEPHPQGWTNFGMGGLSVSGSGPTTRIALGITNSWGNWQGQPVVQLSDDGGQTWREIASQTPHTPSHLDFSGWIDDVEIDPNNPDHVMHVFGGGIWETTNASAASPSWSMKVNGLEETATLSLMTPPPGADYQLLNSSGDVGMFVHTDLTQSPTRSPLWWFTNSNSADMAWAAPSYIAAIGIPSGSHPGVAGAYSTDSGVSWTAFAANHPDGLANTGEVSNIAVTTPGNVIWAPSNSRPAYTTDNGATWTYTNLPALASVGVNRAYRLVADRKNPNKVYAYDSGGAWWNKWSDTAHFWYSTDGGHTFTESTAFKSANPMVTDFSHSSVAVNPNVEGDIWLVDGASILHSTDSGMTWTKLNMTGSIYTSSSDYPEVYGATSIALGAAPAGAAYSSSIYLVGTIYGTWGLYRSDDGFKTWVRVNDDQHQYAGIGPIAADQSVVGRVFIAGAGRGILYNF